MLTIPAAGTPPCCPFAGGFDMLGKILAHIRAIMFFAFSFALSLPLIVCMVALHPFVMAFDPIR